MFPLPLHSILFLRDSLLASSSRYAVFKVHLVGSSGLEPPTSRLSGARSNHLSYEPSYGGDERVRTDGLLLARQALSQLSYTPTQFPASLAGSSLKVLSLHPQNHIVLSSFSPQSNPSASSFFSGYSP